MGFARMEEAALILIQTAHVLNNGLDLSAKLVSEISMAALIDV